MLVSSAWVAIALPFDGHIMMPTTTLMKKIATPKTTEPVLHVNLDVSLEEQIAQRAHELWHHGGRKPGSDLTNWFRAECEINEWHQRRLKKD
jgi:hypothetical protein